MVTHSCEYAENQWVTYFKMVNFMLCKLYLLLKNEFLTMRHTERAIKENTFKSQFNEVLMSHMWCPPVLAEIALNALEFKCLSTCHNYEQMR